MKVEIDELKKIRHIELNEKIDCSDLLTNDPLVKKINYIDAKVNIDLLSKDEFSVIAEYDVNVDYLDARTLDELNLEFTYEDDMLFSLNEEKAEELELDYIEEELNLAELLFDLALVSLPVNYSENKNDSILDEEILMEESNRPFEEIFKTK